MHSIGLGTRASSTRLRRGWAMGLADTEEPGGVRCHVGWELGTGTSFTRSRGERRVGPGL